MSLTKRGNTYWVRFTAPSGERVQRSARTGNRAKAQQFHDQLKAEYWRVQQLGQRPTYTWEQAVVRWLTEQKDKASIEDDKHHLRWMDPHLRGLALSAVTRDKIDALRHARRAEGKAPATVNRMLEVLRAILRRARDEWEWVDRVPAVRMEREPRRRVRWITPVEARRLLLELPEHLKRMAAFSLATGLREANVTRLEWSQVDLQRRVAWVHPDQSKSRRAISVPLNDQAVMVLKACEGDDERWVFVYEGHPVLKANTRAWRQALGRAGIEGFRWHDLRHTWASWHVQNGTPLPVLQELGGWASHEMVLRYAHLAPAHISQYAGNTGTNLVQPETSDLLSA